MQSIINAGCANNSTQSTRHSPTDTVQKKKPTDKGPQGRLEPQGSSREPYRQTIIISEVRTAGALIHTDIKNQLYLWIITV